MHTPLNKSMSTHKYTYISRRIYLFMYWRLIAQSTAQGHLRALHWFKSYRSWIQYNLFIIYLFIEGWSHSHKVTSSLFTGSSPTQVEYNTKHIQYTNVKHINIIRKLVSSVLQMAHNVRRCWYHWQFRSGVSIPDFLHTHTQKNEQKQSQIKNTI